MTTTISTEDTSTTIALHVQSSEMYALRFASLWEGNECVGATITAVCGPLNQHAMRRDGEMVEGWYDHPFDFDANEADWANEQEWSVVADHNDR